MISVILCTYNRASRLEATLESLHKLHVPPDLVWELVVVDNNSSDGTEALVRAYQRAVRFDVRYVFERTQGHSHARNRGIVESRGDILAFTDDDVIVDAHWLERIQDVYDRYDCMGLGGKIVPVWPCPKPRWLKEDGPYALMKAIVSFDHGEEVLALKTPPFGANMSFRRTAFTRYGLFRTDLGRRGLRPAGCEDTEFGTRLLDNNETVMYGPHVVVYHPVDRARATKRYFQRWYFEYGRAYVRQTGLSRAARQRLERHLSALLSLAASVARWTTSGRPERRLYYRLCVWETVGRIWEGCMTSPRSEAQIIPALGEVRPRPLTRPSAHADHR